MLAHAHYDGLDVVCWAAAKNGVVFGEWDGPSSFCWVRDRGLGCRRARQLAMEAESGYVALTTFDCLVFLLAPEHREEETLRWRVQARTDERVAEELAADGLSVSYTGAIAVATKSSGVLILEADGLSLRTVAFLVGGLGKSWATASHMSPSGKWLAAVFAGEWRLRCWRRCDVGGNQRREGTIALASSEASTCSTAVRWRSVAAASSTLASAPETLLFATSQGVLAIDAHPRDEDGEPYFVERWRFTVSGLAACAWVDCGRFVAEAAERDDRTAKVRTQQDDATSHHSRGGRLEAAHGRDNDAAWIIVASRSRSSSTAAFGAVDVMLVSLGAISDSLGEEDAANEAVVVVARDVVVDQTACDRSCPIDYLSATALFSTDQPARDNLRQVRCYLAAYENSSVLVLETIVSRCMWISRIGSDWLGANAEQRMVHAHPSRLLAATVDHGDEPGLVAWSARDALADHAAQADGCCLGLPLRLTQRPEKGGKNVCSLRCVALTWVGDELWVATTDGELCIWHNLDDWRLKAQSRSGAIDETEGIIALRRINDALFVARRLDDQGLNVDAYQVDDNLQHINRLASVVHDKATILATGDEPRPSALSQVIAASTDMLALSTLVVTDDEASLATRRFQATVAPGSPAVAAAISSRCLRVAVVDEKGGVDFWLPISVAPAELRRVATLPADLKDNEVALDIRWVARPHREDEEAVATVDSASKIRLFYQNPQAGMESWWLVAQLDHAIPLSARAFVGLEDLLAQDRLHPPIPSSTVLATTKMHYSISDVVKQLSLAICGSPPDSPETSSCQNQLFDIPSDYGSTSLEPSSTTKMAEPAAARLHEGSSSTPFHRIYAVACSFARAEPKQYRRLCGAGALAAFFASDDALANAAKDMLRQRVAEGMDFLVAASLDRLAWWAPIHVLKAAYLEAAAEVARVARKKHCSCARAAALPYIAAGRAATLASLAKADSSQGDPSAARFAQLLAAFDFQSERGINAARKNAFSLLSKRDFALATAVFCLANPVLVNDAAQVAVDKLEDFDIAFAIARLADHAHAGQSAEPAKSRLCGPHTRAVLRKIILPRLQSRGDHPMRALALVWLNRPLSAGSALDTMSKVSFASGLNPIGCSYEDVEHTISAMSVPLLFGAVTGRDKSELSTEMRRRFDCLRVRAAAAALQRRVPFAALRMLKVEVCSLPVTFLSPALTTASIAKSTPTTLVHSVSPAVRPVQSTSVLDNYDTAPQLRAASRPLSPPERALQQPSMLAGFDAATQRRSQQSPQSDKCDTTPRGSSQPLSMLDGFDAAPQRPSQSRSMLDGFDAAPQQVRPQMSNAASSGASQPRSMLEAFDTAPQRPQQQPTMLASFDAAPQRPVRSPSMLDGFDAAPQQGRPSASNGAAIASQPRSMLDGFEAAPQRPQQQPTILDSFDAAPQRPARPRSILDGVDAAPQQERSSTLNEAVIASQPRSMLDGFEAAPQRAQQQATTVDGFDAAQQRHANPRSMLDGFDAAPQQEQVSSSNGAATKAQFEDPESRRSEQDSDDDQVDDDTIDTEELALWFRQIAIEAGAGLLANVAIRHAADILEPVCVRNGLDVVQSVMGLICENHGLQEGIVAVETLRLLQGNSRTGQTLLERASSVKADARTTGVRPLVAALLVLGAAANHGAILSERAREFAALLVRSTVRRALRLALLPSAPEPPLYVVNEATNLRIELEACVALSLSETARSSYLSRKTEAVTVGTDTSTVPCAEVTAAQPQSHTACGLVGFARPQLVREVAAARRALALCCEPARRELVVALMLRHPPPPPQRRQVHSQATSPDASSRHDGDKIDSSRPSGDETAHRGSKTSNAINAAAAAAIAASHGDVEGWERLQCTDRHGAERALEGKPLGEFLLRPQQHQRKNQAANATNTAIEQSAAIAISFVTAKLSSDREDEDDIVCVQHAIIRVAADPSSGGIKYMSGKLGPCPTLMAILEEISQRLEPHGLLLDGVRRREIDSDTATPPPLTSRITLATMAAAPLTRARKSFSRDYDNDDDEDGASCRLNDSFDSALKELECAKNETLLQETRHRANPSASGKVVAAEASSRWWGAATRASATLDVLTAAALQQQLRSLCGTSRIKGPCRCGKRGLAAIAAIFEDTFSSQVLMAEPTSNATECDDPPALVLLSRLCRSLNRRLFAQLTPGILDDEVPDVPKIADKERSLNRILEGEEGDPSHNPDPLCASDRLEGVPLQNAPAEASFSELGRGRLEPVDKKQTESTGANVPLLDGYILAQMLHPRSGVALSTPRASGTSWSSSSSTLVSPSFAPEAAATWLVDHGHDKTPAMARTRLARWHANNIIVSNNQAHNQGPGFKHASRASPPPAGAGAEVRSRPTMREVKSAENFLSAASTNSGTDVFSTPKQQRHRPFSGHDNDEEYLRYVDAWEVQPLDENDASALMRPCMLGRSLYSPIQGDDTDDLFLFASELRKVPGLTNSHFLCSPWRSLRCDAFLESTIARALPPAARTGKDECFGGDDDALIDSCSPWPPPPAASASNEPVFRGSDPFKSRLRRHLYRNALFRRAGIRRRFIALVQVDLVALENIAESLLDGAEHPQSAASVLPRQQRVPGQASNRQSALKRGGKHGPSSTSSSTNDAFAVLRLKHARLPGGGASPPLSERVRTRDSVVAARKVPDNHHHRDNYWGVSGAFRFALPDEALPSESAYCDDGDADFCILSSASFDSVAISQSASPRARRYLSRRDYCRLPTRGPPHAAHICVYERAANPILSSLGLAPAENFLGDVEVPLGGLTDDDPLIQWLPLRGSGPASSWFVKKPPPPPTIKKLALLRASFSDDGRTYSSGGRVQQTP